MSVLAGDWLYMQSFEMALHERNFEILDILIDLTQNMVEGELLQLTRLGKIDLTETEATELAYRKTACLFSGCARLGAVLGNQPKQCRNRWRSTGETPGWRFNWWTIFSISRRRTSSWQAGAERPEGREDDAAVDFRAEANGAARIDSRDGNGHANGDARRLVAKVLEERDFRSVRPEEISKLVQQTGALARATHLAQDYVERAKECLEDLPDTEYRKALLVVPDFILERQN